ncbi:MAG: 3-oxoacyl-(acyl-carrier-protein) synthase, partial [Myxococcota bacterium]
MSGRVDSLATARRPPVAIVSMGACCAIGNTVDEVATAIEAGRTGLSALARFEAPQGAIPVGQVAILPGTSADGSATHRLAIAAASEAILGARKRISRWPAPARIAAIVGTTTGGIEQSSEWYLGGRSPKNAGVLRKHSASTVSSAVARVAGAEGVVLTISTACSSGANAIMLAADLINTGEADLVIAGGADGLCPLTFDGFSSLKLTSTTPCRPFDEARNGLNLGEAGAFVVLANEALVGESVGWFLGGGLTCDAHHMTAPSPTGDAVVRAMQLALAQAGMGPEDVDYINAHGTATQANDRAEAAAFTRLFMDRIPPVSAS